MLAQSTLVQTSVDVSSHFQGDIVDMIINSSAIIQLDMIIMFLFSVFSWAIIFWKYRVFHKAKVESDIFLEAFWEGKGLTSVFAESRHLKYSPLAAQFRAAFIELNKLQKTQVGGNPGPEPAGSKMKVAPDKAVQHLGRTLDRTVIAEMSRLGRAMTFLATIGNTSPLLGLFGTVWGIMNSFRSIGIKGSANLAVVAPGIAEALITTVVGLIAAIPALIFYNYFANRLSQQEAEMEAFSADFINRTDLG